MDRIEQGFTVFVHDGDVAFGAVREVRPGGLVIYVENSGDYVVPLSAVKEVESDKVVLDCGSLDLRLRQAIGHAHEHEDPNVARNSGPL